MPRKDPDPASIFGACEKRRYPHERAARAVAEDQMERARDRGQPLTLRVYRCPKPYCNGWHLTSRKDGDR